MFGFWDIAVITVFAAAVLICAVRGFVKSLAGIARLVGAFLLAKLFCPVLGKIISENMIGPRVYSWLREKVAAMLGGLESSAGLNTLFEENSEFSELLNRFGASEEFETLKLQYGEGVAATEESLSELVRSFAAPWVDRFSTAVAAVLIFVVAFLLLFLLTKLLVFLVERIDILNRTNRFLGLLLGLVAGVCCVVGLCYLSDLLAGFLALTGGSAETVTDAVETSAVFGHIYRFVMGLAEK